jgi:hypothetical protein
MLAFRPEFLPIMGSRKAVKAQDDSIKAFFRSLLGWEKIVCVFGKLGYRMTGQKGSHVKVEKPGAARPLIVPRY